jgi:hypothetical protein
LALACAAIDMILAGKSPIGWPVAELIELLDQPGRRRDQQVDRLLASLRRIAADIDLAAPDDDSQEVDLQRRAA